MGVSAAPASIEIIIDFSTSTVEPHKTLVEQRWGSVKTSWEEKSNHIEKDDNDISIFDYTSAAAWSH